MPSESLLKIRGRRSPCLAKRAPILASILAIPIMISFAASRSSAAPQIGGEVVRLEGSVFAERGERVSGARVRLESEEGDEVFEIEVNEQGRYAFAGLHRAIYHLVATAEGYETTRQSVDLTRSPSRSIVDIMMAPLRAEGTSREPVSLTDAKAPRKARKAYDEGMKDLATNDIPQAKAQFAKAVKEYPCYARAQTAFALGRISDRDLKGAEAALRQAIDCDAGFTGAYLKLGELYNAELRFEDSQKVLEDGMRLQPGSWKFHYHLGTAYYGLGTYGKAEEEFLRSESLTPPAPPDVHVKLADVYSKERLFGRAYAEMKAYIQADPDGPFAPKVRSVMQEMRTLAAAHSTAPDSGASPASPAKTEAPGNKASQPPAKP